MTEPTGAVHGFVTLTYVCEHHLGFSASYLYSLQKVATACMDVWRQKMKDDYLQYLRNCKKKLCDEVDTVTKDLEGIPFLHVH